MEADAWRVKQVEKIEWYCKWSREVQVLYHELREFQGYFLN